MTIGRRPDFFYLDFFVENVRGESFDFGNRPRQGPAQNGVLILDVSSCRPEIPVKQIRFYGNSPVSKGYFVRATISNLPTSLEEIEEMPYHRALSDMEEAIQVAILDSKGEVLRTDNSTTYSSYREHIRKRSNS